MRHFKFFLGGALTKCDAKVMTHLNFDRNNGKPAVVTSWGLRDVGGWGWQVEAWRGNLSLEGGSCPHSTPQMTPLYKILHRLA